MRRLNAHRATLLAVVALLVIAAAEFVLLAARAAVVVDLGEHGAEAARGGFSGNGCPLSPPGQANCPDNAPGCPRSPPGGAPPCGQARELTVCPFSPPGRGEGRPCATATPTPPECPPSPPAFSPPCVTPTPPSPPPTPGCAPGPPSPPHPVSPPCPTATPGVPCLVIVEPTPTPTTDRCADTPTPTSTSSPTPAPTATPTPPGPSPTFEPNAPTLFIDANGEENGTCNPTDTTASVASGRHSVQVCLTNNTGGTVDALEIVVAYNHDLNRGIELGGTGTTCDDTVGVNCVDDNPDLNQGTGPGELGSGWDCGVFQTSQPQMSGRFVGGSAIIQCLTLPGATLQNGLIATFTFEVAGAGEEELALGSSSGVSLSGVIYTCSAPASSGRLNCIGAAVVKGGE